MKQLFTLCLVFPLLVFSQGRIILNGATIIIQNGGSVEIQNSHPNAITILDSSSGIQINDATSQLRWHIGAKSDHYYIPFKHANLSIPLSFSTSQALGTGFFDLSTYHVPTWKNSDHLSPGVSNINHNGIDNSNQLLDRFWLIHAQGYTTRPVLTNLSFGYIDAEWNASGNKISESMLKAQRWNSSLTTWTDYEPSDISDPANNLVHISSLSSKNLFEWWTLVDADYPINEEQQQVSKMVNGSGSLFNSQTINNPGIRIYPNPVLHTLTIDVGGSGAKKLHIIDVTGRKVHQQLITNNIQNISLSHLPAGTYVLQMLKGEEKRSFKIVKE